VLYDAAIKEMFGEEMYDDMIRVADFGEVR